MTCQHLGGMYAQSARYRQAAGYYERSADALHRLRAFEESVEIRSYLGVMLAGLDRTDQARRELEPVLGILGIDPTVPEPVTRPNHRRAVVVAALAEIELAEGNIDSGLERYLAALRLLSWPHGIIAPGPGDIITASAVINAHALYGRAAAVAEIVGQLTEAGVRRLGQYWDVPQIGSVAMAVGSYLLAVGESVDDGIELLALSIKAAARQDYPSMRWERHMALHRPAVGEERMSAAIQATQGLGRRAASERIMLLLPRFAVAIPE